MSTKTPVSSKINSSCLILETTPGNRQGFLEHQIC